MNGEGSRTTLIPSCKYCQSAATVKFGAYKGVQRYFCKSCRRKFADNDALPKMKTPVNVVASALSCYFGGMPLDAIQRHLQQQFGIYYSEMGIYNWVKRFSRKAADKVKDFQPIVGDTWIADETVLKVGGKNIWFFDVIDKETRYLLASRLADSRTIKETALVMKAAQRRAGKHPKQVITDKMTAYPDGIELAFGANTKHIQSKPFTDVDSTNIIERFHGTLKDRTKVIRGFKNMETARLLTDAWLVYYNFFKEHSALGDVPPAVKMGATPVRDWADVVNGTAAALLASTNGERVVLPRQRVLRKQRHPKRRPEGLKTKSYSEITIATMRG